MFLDSLQRPQTGGMRAGSEGQRQCWNWDIEAHVWVAASWTIAMQHCQLFQIRYSEIKYSTWLWIHIHTKKWADIDAFLFRMFFSFHPTVGEDGWPGPQAQLRPGLPSPWRAGGGSLYQLLHLCYRLQTAVSWPHHLPAHVAPLVQSPILQRLHHVCRCGPETFESYSIEMPTQVSL